MVKRKIVHLLAAFALLVGVGVAVQVFTPSPAAATCPYSLNDSPHGRAWDGVGCSGSTTRLDNAGAFNQQCEGLGTGNGYNPTWSDRISSFENDGGDTLHVWVNFSCQGGHGALPPGSWVNNLTGGFLNNSISSFMFESLYTEGRLAAASVPTEWLPNILEIGTGKKITNENGKLTKFGEQYIARVYATN